MGNAVTLRSSDHPPPVARGTLRRSLPPPRLLAQEAEDRRARELKEFIQTQRLREAEDRRMKELEEVKVRKAKELEEAKLRKARQQAEAEAKRARQQENADALLAKQLHDDEVRRAKWQEVRQANQLAESCVAETRVHQKQTQLERDYADMVTQWRRDIAEAQAAVGERDVAGACEGQERTQQSGADRQPAGRRGGVEIIHLPQVCRRHNTRQGCNNASCRRLHVCRLYLANICKHGVTCRYGHSLTTVHNQMVCGLHDIAVVDEQKILQHLRRDFEANEELPEHIYIRNLERCFKSSWNGCGQSDCNRLHVCRLYVAGRCTRARCPMGHDLHTRHNARVLSRHRVSQLSDEDIINILYNREHGDAKTVKPSASSTADHGAIPRWKSAGDLTGTPGLPSGRKGQTQESSAAGAGPVSAGMSAGISAGLSEELQCPICLDMLSRATTLGCGHTFCAECLQETRMRSGDRCPLCRAAISSAIRSVTLDNIIRNVLTNQ